MIGFAARPGTAVEPMCSIPIARAPSAWRTFACSISNRVGQVASLVDDGDLALLAASDEDFVQLPIPLLAIDGLSVASGL